MPRYFFDSCDGDDVARDPEGQDLPDLEAARHEAVASARELICLDIKINRTVDARVLRLRAGEGRVRLSLAGP